MVSEVAHPDHVAPQEEPVKPGTVVHDDQTWSIQRLLITTDLHSHSKYKLYEVEINNINNGVKLFHPNE